MCNNERRETGARLHWKNTPTFRSHAEKQPVKEGEKEQPKVVEE